jgi:hypothetical protein
VERLSIESRSFFGVVKKASLLYGCYSAEKLQELVGCLAEQ